MCEINVKELLLPLQITGGTNRAPPKGIVGSEMDSAEDLVLGIGSGVFTL